MPDHDHEQSEPPPPCNDHAETWDHLCGPDPNWRQALETDDE